MVKCQLEHLLDECLAQLNRGADLEEVLARYPEHADELRPGLAASAWMREIAPPPTQKRVRKADLLAAVAERRRLVEQVDGAVVELKAGVPVDELARRCGAELAPVIRAAHRMHVTETPMPSAETYEAGRRRLMAMAEERRTEEAPVVAASLGLRQHMLDALRGPTIVRRVAFGSLAAVLALAVALGGVEQVSTVAASSLPGEAFYGVKRFGESAQMLFAFDPARRADLSAAFAERRLDEIAGLRAEGRDVPADLIAAWLESNAARGELSHDQRALLAEALQNVEGADGELDRLDRADAHGVLEMVRGLGDADPVAPSTAPSAEQAGVERSAPALSAPVPRPRPLPQEPDEPAAGDEREQGEEAPIATPPVAEEPPVVEEPPQVWMQNPGADAGATSDEPAAPVAQDPPSAPAAPSEPGGEEPPIVQPAPGADDPGDEPPPFVQPPPDDPSGGAAEPPAVQPAPGNEDPPAVQPAP